MTREPDHLDEQEILTLSDDFYSVEELEERLELATATVDTLCIGNACGANGCVANGNGW
ncbi:hypothetical protein [Ktedonosporobacter rubrisoli]|uniref:hypothetical protein n=1 Tax=Ktedonosporobacter rubrisoli TaxID=2509675 RepID=UPI0013EE6BDE|nr:hypothetical protein [Ktedonosporobacter rubrisoli]